MLRTKNKVPPKRRGFVKQTFFINESDFYSLILSSKLESAKKFKHWVTSIVPPTIKKYGYYKLFDNPNNHIFKTENETDLHCKVVQYIRRFYPDAIKADTHEGFCSRSMLQSHFARVSTHEGAFSSSLNLPQELAPKYLTG